MTLRTAGLSLRAAGDAPLIGELSLPLALLAPGAILSNTDEEPRLAPFGCTRTHERVREGGAQGRILPSSATFRLMGKDTNDKTNAIASQSISLSRARRLPLALFRDV